MARHRPTPKKARKLKPRNKDLVNYKGQLLGRQVQVGVYKLQKYFRRERLNGGPLRPLSQIQNRTSDAIGVSVRVVSRIKRIGDSGQAFETPGKVRVMKKRKRGIDDFTKCAIRNLIYEYHRKRLHLNLKILLRKIRERSIDFHGGQETLRKVLLDLGFKYKSRDGARFLQEQPRIVLLRLAFLRRWMKAHKEGQKSFVYLDETWVFRRGSDKTKRWQDSDVRSCPTRHASNGGRYIVIHAGGRNGFVKGAGKVFPTGKKPQPGDDYHGDMDGRIMKCWFLQGLLANLTVPSIIVMDNAPYHSCQANMSSHMFPSFNEMNFMI